ncbi:hypothetical protein A8B75_12840 [Sphingomonadales bacterium EhC05]|nr:hypothetical protein A8B75_12840 [Sphingomonadales bacterium EhC05]
MTDRQSKGPPSKHLAALFTFIGLLPLVYYIPPWIMENISADNRIVTLLAVGIIVPIISYVFLPICFWTFERLRR